MIQRNALPDPKLVQCLCDTNFQDFHSYSSGGGDYTTYTGSSGSTAWNNGVGLIPNSGAGTWLKAITAATAFDPQGVYETNPSKLPTAQNPAIFVEGYVYWASEATNNANMFFGLASTHAIAPGSNTDPTASFSGALLYRIDGDSYWRTMVSNGSSKTVVDCNNVFCYDGWYKLRIDFVSYDSNNCAVSFKVNDQILTDIHGFQINSVLPYSGLSPMGEIWFMQASTANVQTGYIDYVASSRYRAQLNG